MTWDFVCEFPDEFPIESSIDVVPEMRMMLRLKLRMMQRLMLCLAMLPGKEWIILPVLFHRRNIGGESENSPRKGKKCGAFVPGTRAKPRVSHFGRPALLAALLRTSPAFISLRRAAWEGRPAKSAA